MIRVSLQIRHLALALLVALAGVGAATAAPRHGSRLDNHLRAVIEAQTNEPQRVIIRVRTGYRETLRRALVEHGDRILAIHESLDAVAALVHYEDLDALAQQDFIASVSTDAPVQAEGLLGGVLGVVGGLVQTVGNVVGAILLPNGADTSGPAVPPSVLRSTLGVNNSNQTGQGVGVAIIDSGLEMSWEFSGRLTKFYDFTKGGIEAPAYDDYGHGTHVAGTIGGSGALSSYNEYRGLAPNVKFVVLKVLDKNGAGWTTDVIKAIDFAVANRVALGIDIINLSLGHPIYEPASTDPLVQAVERAVRAGIVVVTAAGNYGKNPETGQLGYAGITSPGNAPSAITVGAVRTEDTVSRGDDRIADYSSAGPTWYDGLVKPDVVAPGHNIVAVAAKQGTLFKTYPSLKAADGDYMRLSGTSMATAVATGSIALLVEANRTANQYPAHRSLTPNAIKAILHYTALAVRDANGVEYGPLREGAGGLNPKGAIELGRTINTGAAVGSYWLWSTPSPWTKIGSEYWSWNKSVTWGTQIIWGTTIENNYLAWSNQIIWGTDEQIIWGTDEQIIWGTTDLVWSDPQSWAQSTVWGANSVTWTGGLSAQTATWKSLAATTANAATISATSLTP